MAEWIEYATRDALSVEEGTLYPALHRLKLVRRKRATDFMEDLCRMSSSRFAACAAPRASPPPRS